MPWTAADAKKHINGLSKKQSRKWASMANAVRESCLESGDKDCDAKAIRIANSKFSEISKAFNPVLNAEQADKIEPIVQKFVKKEFEKMNFTPMDTISEMEIFRAGTHNGHKFTEADLQEMADNFSKLKNEVRPKLKITHREEQNTLAGLASYGDITDVYLKAVEDGSRRLFARVENVPKSVGDFIRNRRFPERSIEIYPKFKLGTQEDSPVYKNVIKAIALLGHEMPAVPGMAPVALSESLEKQSTLCIGQVCFFCSEEAENYAASLLSIEQMAEQIMMMTKI